MNIRNNNKENYCALILLYSGVLLIALCGVPLLANAITVEEEARLLDEIVVELINSSGEIEELNNCWLTSMALEACEEQMGKPKRTTFPKVIGPKGELADPNFYISDPCWIERQNNAGCP